MVHKEHRNSPPYNCLCPPPIKWSPFTINRHRASGKFCLCVLTNGPCTLLLYTRRSEVIGPPTPIWAHVSATEWLHISQSQTGIQESLSASLLDSVVFHSHFVILICTEPIFSVLYQNTCINLGSLTLTGHSSYSQSFLWEFYEILAHYILYAANQMF